MSKYNAQKTQIDGILFDSKAEAHRYAELKMLEKAGVIRKLELQPKYVLQKAFRYKGKVVREVKYIADFKYLEGDKVVVEDVKGMETDVFKLKKKLFLNQYGRYLDFRIVR